MRDVVARLPRALDGNTGSLNHAAVGISDKLRPRHVVVVIVVVASECQTDRFVGLRYVRHRFLFLYICPVRTFYRTRMYAPLNLTTDFV